MRALYKLSWIPSLMVIVGLVFISSCKDDEKPKAKFSFAETEKDILESEGVVEVKINIDKPLSETVVLSYTIEGTATKFTPQSGGDYTISPDGGYITIAAGATEAIIEIEVFEDGNLEVDFDEGITLETIVLTLTSVVSGPGSLGTEGLQYTLNIFEDDLIVFLDWDGSDGTGDVDMDILFWFDSPSDNPDDGLELISPQDIGGANPGNESEAILLQGGNVDATYGFSYVYYEGTSDDLNFTVTFLNFGGTINGSLDDGEFNGTYTQANLNPWDQETGTVPHIAQTMVKSGANYTITNLDLADAGSRQRILIGNMNGVDKSTQRNASAKVSRIKLPTDFLNRFK